MKVSKFKFFHGKIRGLDDYYEEWFRIYDNPTLPTLNDIRTITRNLDINTIINTINNTINRSRTPELIINGQDWEIRY